MRKLVLTDDNHREKDTSLFLSFLVFSGFFVIQILLRKNAKISKYAKILFLLMTIIVMIALFETKVLFCLMNLEGSLSKVHPIK